MSPAGAGATCDVRPAQIRVRNAEAVLLAMDESAAGDGAPGSADDVTVKDDAAHHAGQLADELGVPLPRQSRRPSLVSHAGLASLIVDIDGLTFRVEMPRRVSAESTAQDGD